MSQDILIKNLPLSFLKEKPNSFFTSKEFSDFENLFDKFKKKIDLSSKQVEGISLLPMEELKTVLINKYISKDNIIESVNDKDTMIFIQLSGKKINNLNFKQKKFITSSMSELKSVTPFLASIFLNNNIFLNNYNSGYAKSREHGNSSNLDKLLKPENTNNVSRDVANVSKYYDSILDSLVYDNIAYSTMLKINDLKSNIFINNTIVPFTLDKINIDSLEAYNKKDLFEKASNLKLKLFDKYFNHQHTFSTSTDIYKENDVPPLDILTSLLADKSKDYPLIIRREILLNVDSIKIMNDNVKQKYFRLEVFNKISGLQYSSSIIKNFSYLSDSLIEINFSSKIDGEILLIHDRYQPETIYSKSLLDYYKETNLHKNISHYTSFIENGKVILNLNNYNVGFGLIEVRSKDNSTSIKPSQIRYFKNYIEISFDKKGGKIPVNIYVLPTFKIISNINIMNVDANNVEDFLKNISPFEEEVKAWRVYND